MHIPAAAPLLPRQGFCAHHVVHGNSLTQAAKLKLKGIIPDHRIKLANDRRGPS